MTTPTGTAPYGYVDRVIVGTATEVADTVRSMVERGRLVSMTVPHPVPGGKVAVKVRMVAPTPGHGGTHAATRPPTGPRPGRRDVTGPVAGGRPARRAGVVAAGVAGAVALLAGAGYAVFLLIRELWPLLLAIAVVLFWLRRKLRGA